jgi:hypothetical protein
MEELELRHSLGKVNAPPGFERMVLARVRDIKSGTRPAPDSVRPFGLKLSLAGGLAALLAGFVLLNVFVLQKNGTQGDSSWAGLGPAQTQGRAVPVMDSVDYGREVRNISGDSSAVYILEQVSDNGTSGNIRY